MGQRKSATIPMNYNLQKRLNKVTKDELIDYIPKSNMAWLKKTVIGTIRNGISTSHVELGLVELGFMAKVRIASGFTVLITFNKQREMEKALAGSPNQLQKWLSTIVLYDCDKQQQKFECWVCVEEIPIHAWHKNLFQALRDK